MKKIYLITTYHKYNALFESSIFDDYDKAKAFAESEIKTGFYTDYEINVIHVFDNGLPTTMEPYGESNG